MTVGIFDFKLVGPLEILGRTPDVCALGREFGEEGVSGANNPESASIQNQP
jgi:hypothetical protein